MNVWYAVYWLLHDVVSLHSHHWVEDVAIIRRSLHCHIRYRVWNLSVLHAVYVLPPAKIAKFFSRNERNWHEYLQGQDAFTPEAFARLQTQQRATFNSLRES